MQLARVSSVWQLKKAISLIQRLCSEMLIPWWTLIASYDDDDDDEDDDDHDSDDDDYK